jgi:hypothetical protein
VEQDVLRLAAGLDVDRPEMRATLVGSMIVGMAFARYVVGVEPLASLGAADLVDALAPALQQHLTGPIGEG